MARFKQTGRRGATGRKSTSSRRGVQPITQPEPEASASVPAPPSRACRAHCKGSKCHAAVGEFRNDFVAVPGSSNYVLPALASSYSAPGVRSTSETKTGKGGLAGCRIQALLCMSCGESLGFHCTDAPHARSDWIFCVATAKSHKHQKKTPAHPHQTNAESVLTIYRGRDFFKLRHIELRAEHSGAAVEPVIADMVPDESPRLRADEPVMDETSSAPLAHTTSEPSQPAQKPSAHPANEQPPAARTLDNAVSVPAPVNGHADTNGSRYPSPAQVSLDALSTLQTQVSYNTAAMQTERRDIARIDQAVTRLQMEMRGVYDLLDQVRRDIAVLAARPPPPGPPPPPQENRADDQDRAIELLSTNLTAVTQKAAEVDQLRVQMEIMKRRMTRVEDINSSPAAPSPATFPPHREPAHREPAHREPSHREASIYQTPSHHGMQAPALAPAPVSVPSQAPVYATPAMPDSRQTSSYHPTATPTPDSHPSQQTEAASGGWVPVNTNSKRGRPPNEPGSDGPSSPKRARLPPIEPRRSYEPASGSMYERPSTEESEARFTPRPTQDSSSYQPSYQSSGQQPTFIPFQSTETQQSDESWVPESQRLSWSPRRGGARVGAGRPRKHPPQEVDRQLGTPEWEKPESTGSQVNEHGFYSPLAQNRPGSSGHRGGIVRRGSGGGGHAPSTRPIAVSAAPTIISTTPASSGFITAAGGDPYSHTKKTRTKPIRNADGILIRKDGRPDMRSQSSAANLRKVHARKEQEKTGEGSPAPQGPTSGLATAPVLNGSSNTTESTPEHDVEMTEPNTDQRHEANMKQIFPHGIDKLRARMNHAGHFFSEGSGAGGAAMMEEKAKASASAASSRSPDQNGGAVQAVIKGEEMKSQPMPGFGAESSETPGSSSAASSEDDDHQQQQEQQRQQQEVADSNWDASRLGSTVMDTQDTTTQETTQSQTLTAGS